MTKSFFFFFFAICILQSPLYGQKRKELETQRKKLIGQIKLTSQLLKDTKANREATLDRYITLQKQIQKRQELILTLQEEISYSNQSIDRSNEVVAALAEDVDRLKEEYSEMIRSAYRQKLNKSSLLFIFSAGSFNEAFRRWQYLKQYDSYRQKQARLILETQSTLNSKITSLEKRKEEKEKLLGSEERQTEILSLELLAKDELLKKLQGDETRLASDLKTKQVAHSKLNNAIEKIIRNEIEKKRKEERNSVASKKKESAPAKTSPELRSFNKFKGKLPWPVKKGVITSYFGKQAHPTIKNIQITNNGVDIQTDINAEVRVVHEGKVAGTQFIPSYDYMVIVQHGNFYTVYSNLEEVFVRKGDRVKAKQVIGKVSTDSRTNKAEVHFEVWKEKTRLNPTDWVSKK